MLHNKLFNNSVIIRLIREGRDISEVELKKVYRQLCKETHPDLTKSDGLEFQNLQQEYELARKCLKELRQAIKSRKKDSQIIITYEQIEKKFFESLKYYTISGLHSAKLRRKPELKVRNSAILKEVLYWANLYDPDFYNLFLEYNRVYFRVFKDVKKEQKFYLGRKLFLQGLRHFFDYYENRLQGTYNTTLRCFHDSFSILRFTSADHPTLVIMKFIQWLIAKLDMLSKGIK